VTVRRIRGGANNALYRVDVEGQSFACKLCVDDERRRAAREYGALDLLRRAGLDIAPQPLWLDESRRLFPYPAVAYVWLSGEPMYPLLTGAQLAALLATVQSSHSIRMGKLPGHRLGAAWFHWFDFGVYLAEMADFIDDYGPWLATSDPDGPALLDRLTQPVTDRRDVRARMIRFIERAEVVLAS